MAYDTTHGLCAQFSSSITRHQHEGCRPIVYAARVSRGDGAVFFEYRRQFRETLHGGLGTGVLIGIEERRFSLSAWDRDGNQLLSEAFLAKRLARALLGTQGVFVLVLPGDGVLFCQYLGGFAHRVSGRGIQLAIASRIAFLNELIHYRGMTETKSFAGPAKQEGGAAHRMGRSWPRQCRG